MSDIVKLIEPPTDYSDTAIVFMSAGNLRKARDEITTLRVENDALAKSCAAAAENNERLRAEVEKLKAARDLVLEEAARCAEDYEGKGMEIDYIRQSGDASRTRSDIAAAIRALKGKTGDTP